MLENIQKLIIEKLGDAALVSVEEAGLQPALIVHKDYIVDIALLLRDTEGLYFDFLSNIAAVDYHPEDRFTIVYHIASIPYQTQLVLKVHLAHERS